MNNLSQFWQELKRRKVVRVITVYAAAAFVILELVDIITEPFGLPDWTLKLVVVLLIIGLIVSVIFSWIYDIKPEGRLEKTLPPNKIKPEDKPDPSNSWKMASYISFTVIIVLIGYNVLAKTNRRTNGISETIKSIAVLPFHNYSTNPEQEYMCDGLTDEIINHLYKIKSFDKVVSLNSVLTYKGSNKKSPQIADELKVNYILQGTYKKIGEQLRVTAQLIEADSDTHLWQNEYDRPYEEIISIQSDIALQIADQVKAYISKSEKKEIQKIPTTNPKAYELLQQAIYMPESSFIYRNYEYLEAARKAIQLDPNYANAYAWAGIWTLYTATYSGDREMSSVGWEALPYFEKALELDENTMRANFGMGHIYEWARWDYVKAENSYLKGINLEPNNYPNYPLYIEFFLKMGRFDDALDYFVKASDSDQYIPVGNKIKLNVLTGNNPEALTSLNKDIKVLGENFHVPMAELFIWLQEYDSAKYYLESAINSNDPNMPYPRFHACLALAYHKTKDYKNARKIISQLIAKSDTTSVGSPDFFTGWYYSYLGELDSAFFWLEKAFNNRSPEMPWLKVDPAFNNLKEDDRYWDLYERTGHKAYDDYMAGKNK